MVMQYPTRASELDQPSLVIRLLTQTPQHQNNACTAIDNVRLPLEKTDIRDVWSRNLVERVLRKS
jgi:hypothetical protein